MKWKEWEKGLGIVIKEWRKDLGNTLPDEADYSELVDNLAFFIHNQIEHLEADNIVKGRIDV